MIKCVKLTFAYFKTGDESLFISVHPFLSERRCDLGVKVRDPYLFRDGDSYRLLFTEAWDSQRIGVARSDDLIRWEFEGNPVICPGATCCWAPEAIPVFNSWMVYWSSATRDHHSVIKFSMTKDFENFSNPRTLFDPGYPVIDATIRWKNLFWLMAFKDEREEFKCIRTAMAETPLGEWKGLSRPLSPKGSEGPIILKNKILYDHYAENSWGVVGEGRYHAPMNARHGSVIIN